MNSQNDQVKFIELSLFQYGEEGTDKSFMVEVTWGEQYPNELPKISLDTYYNRNMLVEMFFSSLL